MDGFDGTDVGLAAQAKARTAWVERGALIRWTYWVRLGWHADRLDATSANADLEKLVGDLYLAKLAGPPYPTVRLFAGFHSDPYPHAHAAVYLSRRRRLEFVTADEFAQWLRLNYWSHGPVWAALFDPGKKHPEHGGAIEYLARDPGSVVWG
jgi:hypothetical protein